jgi:aromatic ring hydroxylase
VCQKRIRMVESNEMRVLRIFRVCILIYAISLLYILSTLSRTTTRYIEYNTNFMTYFKEVPRTVLVCLQKLEFCEREKGKSHIHDPF